MDTSRQQLVNSIDDVSNLLGAVDFERFFLVVDQPAYLASGASEALAAVLNHSATACFTDFELNPKIEDVVRGIVLYREFRPDLVIAVGGGTAIDLAKLIGVMADQQAAPREIATGKASLQSLPKPLMAIPTTAGTGSEATHFAVVYVDGEKYSLAAPSMLPDYAVVDWKLTTSLPRRMTVATGLDALCQAIESIWAVAANDESLAYSIEAARLASENLVVAANSPTPAARQAMSRASYLAGKAINITKTTAPHALSYFLTSRYGVPHGMAVASTLASLLEYNAGVTDDDCADPRGANAVRQRIELVLQTLRSNSVAEACSKIVDLLAQLESPLLTEIVDGAAVAAVVDSANLERLSNNPRRANRDQLIAALSARCES